MDFTNQLVNYFHMSIHVTTTCVCNCMKVSAVNNL